MMVQNVHSAVGEGHEQIRVKKKFQKSLKVSDTTPRVGAQTESRETLTSDRMFSLQPCFCSARP